VQHQIPSFSTGKHTIAITYLLLFDCLSVKGGKRIKALYIRKKDALCQWNNGRPAGGLFWLYSFKQHYLGFV